MILVDTSVWVDFFRGVDSPERWALHKLIEDKAGLGLCGIVIAEVLQGIRKDNDFYEVKTGLLAFPIFEPSGIETYLNAARIHRVCRKQGLTIRKTVDCVIAAICLEHNLTLLHKDRDFEMIEKGAGLICLKI